MALPFLSWLQQNLLSALSFHVSITIGLVSILSGLSGQSKVKPIMAGQVIHQSHFFLYTIISSQVAEILEFFGAAFMVIN